MSCAMSTCVTDLEIIMSFRLYYFLLLLLLSSEGRERKILDDYLNTCLDGKNHKLRPGPEGTLFQKCAPWNKRSCCQRNVTKSIHTSDVWFNFSWHHCAPLSPQCQSYFIQDLCFYECTPNGGPWIVQDSGMKIRKERYFNLPLCSDECNKWWNSCKSDSTCIENWTRGFDWSTGRNYFHLGSH
ncbi:FOLR [Acanthosepion pharaonis]|uniref:FOLR n=1 Tax=Acanthosepion pharaonis TaxID=158019 RepID=A0A812CLW7_ACAPH|nr:FOLR [Sepia pharaonis]